MEEIAFDVDEIMREIRDEAAKLPDNEPVLFDNIPFSKLNSFASMDLINASLPEIKTNLSQISEFLDRNAYNPYYTEVGVGVKSYLKRIIRKVNKFLIFPMSERQNELNTCTACAIASILELINRQQHQIDRLEEEITKQKSAFEKQNKVIEHETE